MNLEFIDYSIIILFFVISMGIGIFVGRQSGKNVSEYFLSGRNMPWWLLGISMVATTFSTDTPNLVTNMVRKNGVSGNWEWWAFLLTGLLTVFVYARLWRKANIATDLGFYSLRYGGKPAHFLRGFRAIYLGLLFNILAMAGVTLAAIKMGQIILGFSPIQTVGIASLVTVIFSSIGGFKGVVYTDFILFFVAMIGTTWAAYYCVSLPEIGGLSTLMSHENVIGKISLLPSFDDPQMLIALLIIPLAVQWWSSWYPGAEPGGGGYIAQRMLASKNENHAIVATLFFNIVHYAIRPWPWIIIALCSLVLFPELQDIKTAFPSVSDNILGHDLAYSAMLTKLPAGLIGLVLASLIAAYMSTISTHLNWGASYIVSDFYVLYVNKNAPEKELVRMGKISTVLLMIFSALLALSLNNAMQLFDYVLMFGAGTGLIFILRWFWWRINAMSEISAMFSSGIVSLLLNITSIRNFLFGYDSQTGSFVEGVLPPWADLPLSVAITTLVWVSVTLLTKPEDDAVLFSFFKRIQPGGSGWNKIIERAKQQEINIVNPNDKHPISSSILAMLLGCVVVYSILFFIGFLLYEDYSSSVICAILVLVSSFFLARLWKKIKQQSL